jgi:predicted PurR-regulated permease PerM
MTAGKSIVGGIISIALGLMIGFYMLFDFDKLNKHIENVLPKKWRKIYQELGERLNDSLRDYIQGLLLIMVLVFITQSIGLTLAGLKAPLIFALFCALTDVIPYFGPYIGAIPAVIVGFTVSPITGICCIVAILIVQMLENNFYQPLIMGHTMKLHPVTIMLGLLIFQHFFGIIGMIVATPVIACGKVIFTYIDEKLNIIGKLTGDKAN